MIATPSSANLMPETAEAVTPAKSASRPDQSGSQVARDGDGHDDSHQGELTKSGAEASVQPKNPISELALAHKFYQTISSGSHHAQLAIVQDRAFRGGLIIMLASPLQETVTLALQTMLLLAQSPDPAVFAPIRAELAFRTAISHFLSEPGVDPKIRELAGRLAKRPDPAASGLRIATAGCMVSPNKRNNAPACSPVASTSASSSSGLSTRGVAGWPTVASSNGAVRTGSPRRMASVSRAGGGYASRAPSTARSIFTPTRSRALYISLHQPTTISPRLHTAISSALLSTPGIISFTIETPSASSPPPAKPRIVLRVVPTIQADDLLQHLVRKIPALVREQQIEEDGVKQGEPQEPAVSGIALGIVIPARRAGGEDTLLPAVRTPEPEDEDQDEDDNEAESEEDDDEGSSDEEEEDDDPYASATKRTELNKRSVGQDAPGYLDDNGVDPFAEDDADDKENTAKVVPRGWLGKMSSWLGW